MESCLAVSPDRQANRPDQIRPDQTGGGRERGREGERERGREGGREGGWGGIGRDREGQGGIGRDKGGIREG